MLFYLIKKESSFKVIKDNVNISFKKDEYDNETFRLIKKKNDNSIFISIASYRDKDCVNTILDCLQKAKFPKNIRIGICQQNKENDLDVIHNEYHSELEPYIHQIRIIRIPYYEARGPTFARYLCSTLWDGETFYMQIDSHMRFESDWDQKCISMFDDLDDKVVLSTYPKEIENKEGEDIPVICNVFLSESENMITFPGASLIEPSNRPIETGFIAAGFFFTNSDFLKEIPFDPRLPDLFVGEEILLSIRFWTNGWNIYAPNQNIIYHHYIREGEPKVWTDRIFNSELALKKVKQLIGLSDETPPNDINVFMHIYGLGKTRTLKQYYDFIQFQFDQNKSNKNFCVKEQK
jgi:hypothetical protein